MNRFSKISATCLALLVCMFASLPLYAQEDTVITGYQFPEWNECDNITLKALEDDWSILSSKPTEIISKGYKSTRNIEVNLNIDDDATFIFNFYRDNGNTDYTLSVLVDGHEYLNSYDLFRSDMNNFIDLKAGSHRIEISHNTTATGGWHLYNIGVLYKTKNIKTVNLLEPGSLGTEILYSGFNSLFDVRSLKVRGKMNDVDLSTITKMKDNLFYLDLSESEFQEVPNSWLASGKFINTVILPEGLKKINEYAFSYSTLKYINFPTSLELVDGVSFQSTNLVEAIFDLNSKTNIGTGAFRYSRSLRKVVLPKGVKTLFFNTFGGCYRLSDITFPESLTTIERQAFMDINKDKTKEELILPNGVKAIGEEAFGRVGFSKITLPTSLFELKNSNIFSSSEITEIRLESPTVVNVNNNIFGSIKHSDLTLVVPDFLLNQYKLADYWYDFGTIKTFPTSEISDWELNNDLTLDAHNRFKNNPNMKITASGSFSVIGTDPLEINDLTICSNFSANIYGRLISKIDDFKVNGKVVTREYMEKNKWYYLSLPYNVKVSEIAADNESPLKAIRYYDGTNRANNGTGNNWVNFEANAIIPAGTGFIFLTSEDAWWNFPAQEDVSKQFVTSNKMFAKALKANPSATPSDMGWNLVGNPYQSWYNIHKLNFTAPITVRNVSKNTYEAYSIIDDDFALAPNQAFFVQCPDGTSEISFPTNGRQLTSVVTEQNAAPARNPQLDERFLIDLALSNGDSQDRTRVVINRQASEAYELSCDASKFLSEADVPQLYTLDSEGTMYAINERPLSNGEVQLGIVIPSDGTYTFSLLKNMTDNVMIRDNETGETVEISAEGYSFYAEAGTQNNRFTLIVKSDSATGISSVKAETVANENCYNLSGQKVSSDYKGIVIKNGKKVIK